MTLKKKIRMHILYYITPHGFGHAVRSAAICNRISEDIKITFRTTIPRSFFEEEMKRDFSYEPDRFDCGCEQLDGVTVDIEKTAETYLQISRENRKKLSSEINLVKSLSVDLIISDIVPFAFEVAYAIDIPSIGISNFNWVDIYGPYVEKEALFKPIIKEISDQYNNASYLFRLEPSNDLKGFNCEEFKVPFVCGEGRNREGELRKIINVDPSKKIAVIYIGNYGMEDVDWRSLEEFEEWVFLGVYPLPGSPDNFFTIDKEQISYRDVAASADLVIGKIGYGTTSECVINKTPLLYIPRDDFAEHPILEKFLLDNNLGLRCHSEKFKDLDIKNFLDKAIKLKDDCTIGDITNGTVVSSQKIEEILNKVV